MIYENFNKAAKKVLRQKKCFKVKLSIAASNENIHHFSCHIGAFEKEAQAKRLKKAVKNQNALNQ